MRSPDNDARIKGKKAGIPDFKNAASGLNGIKAPFGYKQTGDILDRANANGTIKPQAYELKK